MIWWSVAGIAAVVLALAAVLMRLSGRRRARRWAAWRREHARRLPWMLFQRRRSALRLTDERGRPHADERGPGR